jgi:hypothetical protein
MSPGLQLVAKLFGKLERFKALDPVAVAVGVVVAVPLLPLEEVVPEPELLEAKLPELPELEAPLLLAPTEPEELVAPEELVPLEESDEPLDEPLAPELDPELLAPLEVAAPLLVSWSLLFSELLKSAPRLARAAAPTAV